MSERENFEVVLEEIFSYYRRPRHASLFPRIGVVGNIGCLTSFSQGTKEWSIQAVGGVCFTDDSSIDIYKKLFNKISIYRNYRALVMSEDVDILMILPDCENAFDIASYALEKRKSVICAAYLSEVKIDFLDKIMKPDNVFFIASRDHILDIPMHSLCII